MTRREIVVRGAREHNLKGIDLRVPHGTITTFTGVSGSGKTSLAFDTIHREAQRRFLESLSTYARQFLGGYERPRVDEIDGLSPSLSIDQKRGAFNPRSTVGTVTEIHDHLRLLFARLGEPRCPHCGRALAAQTHDQIVDRILEEAGGRRVYVLAPIVRDRKGGHRRELEALRLKGFVRVRIDGRVVRLDEGPEVDGRRRHTIEAVVDRLRAEPERRGRLAEAVETAARLGDGVLGIWIDEEEERTYSTSRACPDCGFDFPELEPRLFSFNSPAGACPECEGLGEVRRVDPDLLVAHPERSIREGALAVYRDGYLAYSRLGPESLERVARAFGFSLDVPWRELPEEARRILLYGSGERRVKLVWEYENRHGDRVRGESDRPVPGLVPAMERFHRATGARFVERYMRAVRCAACGGSRLGEAARSVFFRDRSLPELSSLTISHALRFFDDLALEGREEAIGREIVREIRDRLRFLERVGVGYLPLDRPARTLSGGEAQRVRLAGQLGQRLQGVTYVLDEPSIGLHARDQHRLLETLRELRDAGNTVLVVEHDAETMRCSDLLVDIGPGAGEEGGRLVASGPPEVVARSGDSPTARFLRGEARPTRSRRRPRDPSGWLTVVGARENNLRDVTVRFPLGCLVAVTGVSGSGKSTLVDLVLRRALARTLHGARERPGRHERIEGIEQIDKVVEIDQKPIGRTPRSNPATYSGAFTPIRDLFAGLPESRARGYPKGRFSFNVPGGRCEACEGAGVRTVEMPFLADVEVTCDVCGGRRYGDETLEVRYRGRSILDVLEMSVEEALRFFENHPRIARILRTLDEVGLGYVRLGQPATTLSGGEAQRLKLASELSRPSTGRTLYLLDEPTTGLHSFDVERLLSALERLVERGNSVVVVEHHLDVIRAADWMIDLGPEGGEEGGRVVYAGRPSGAERCPESQTGAALRRERKKRGLGGARGRGRPASAPAPQGLVVRGARTHNLRSVDLDLPRGSFVVVTGVSGSGKSSLAFDTLHAEAQRRYVDALGTYARRFLARLDKPPVDRMEGLMPSVAIDRRPPPRNPRSTVSTQTEVHDLLRVLFAHAGTPHCPECDRELRSLDPEAAADLAVERLAGRRVLVLCTPRADLRRAEARRALLEEGFVRLFADGEVLRIDAVDAEALARALDVRLVVDRIVVGPNKRSRLVEAIELAYAEGGGVCCLRDVDGGSLEVSRRLLCPQHGVGPGEAPHPRWFSFNARAGACPTCDGIGSTERVNPDRLLAHPERPLFGGALAVGREDLDRLGATPFLRAVARRHGVSLREPIGRWPAEAVRHVLFGGEEALSVRLERKGRRARRVARAERAFPGLVALVEERLAQSSEQGFWRRRLGAFVEETTCPDCGGSRLAPVPRSFRLGGLRPGEVAALTVSQARSWLASLEIGGAAAEIVKEALEELGRRLALLDEIGLGYLTLDRPSHTLSGGEAQRIRLAAQLGTRLCGVLYVLDEPTVGLHPRDTERLVRTLLELRDLGNTVVVVEHDLDVIRRADLVVDMGPGPGRRGGRVVAAGAPEELARHPQSLTGRYLAGGGARPLGPRRRRAGGREAVRLRGARWRNLKDVDLEVPLGAITAVSGVSGSGKSTLVMDLLVPAAREALAGREPDGPFARLEVPDGLSDVVVVDAAPLGPTPASNPATYTGVFDAIRQLFASSPEARARGFTKRRFSFNQSGGRCEACEGRGFQRIEMHFLSDVFVTCDACGGRRFDRETLSVRISGRSIADVLDMEVSEALEFFAGRPRIERVLSLLEEVGLGYLRLGQPAPTLSGGESQRVKIAAELGRRRRGRTLYVLDEPTTGLHPHDVERLLDVLARLADRGDAVLVVEHHLGVLAAADRIVELGPEGGEEGGRVVACGTPEEVAAVPESPTGRFLRREIAAAPEVEDGVCR